MNTHPVALGNLGSTIGSIGILNALLPVDKSLKELLSELEEVKSKLEIAKVPKVPLIQKLSGRYTRECETFLFEPLRSNCCEECGRGCKHISLDEWHKIKKLREALKDNKEFDELCNKILEEK